jgi:DNA-directed RNA polymerase II subunit RPB2
MTEKLQSGEIKWNDLLVCSNNHGFEAVLEYIDPDEQNINIMLAMTPKDLYDANLSYQYPNASTNNFPPRFTHCEIHPSTIFGVLASCIPFPEHNQSPRNCYQVAMSKQSIGIHATNFDLRMDKTSYLLTYPSRPMVDTRLMKFLKLDQIPSGSQVIVAIMSWTGYNQEDSILMNQASVDRGLFMATIYHTEKDENKKINGDEQVRCAPDFAKTKGKKYGNYDKLGQNGFVPENTLIENRDMIIGKILPLKENRNDPTKIIKYEDQSKAYKTEEECYVDKNYMSRNGDGYNFAKVRIRATRKPVRDGWKPYTRMRHAIYSAWNQTRSYHKSTCHSVKNDHRAAQRDLAWKDSD